MANKVEVIYVDSAKYVSKTFSALKNFKKEILFREKIGKSGISFAKIISGEAHGRRLIIEYVDGEQIYNYGRLCYKNKEYIKLQIRDLVVFQTYCNKNCRPRKANPKFLMNSITERYKPNIKSNEKIRDTLQLIRKKTATCTRLEFQHTFFDYFPSNMLLSREKPELIHFDFEHAKMWLPAVDLVCMIMSSPSDWKYIISKYVEETDDFHSKTSLDSYSLSTEISLELLRFFLFFITYLKKIDNYEHHLVKNEATLDIIPDILNCAF